MELQVVYDAFLAQIDDDEWIAWDEWEREEDWYQLFLAAVSWFRFPRVSLELDEERENFIDEEISNSEVQVIVGYMKLSWLSRVVNSWENLRPLYQERDFSPATMLNEFRLKEQGQAKLAKEIEARYYRSIDGKPFPFRRLYGRGGR